MNTEKQDPQGDIPGGRQDSSCGGTHSVSTSVLPLNEHVIERLRALSDDELSAFSAELDTALRTARRGPDDPSLTEATDIAVQARHMVRTRRAHVAGDRARDLIRQLLSTTETPR